ncbi:thiamine ABC transporter substrate-binding protein [Nocardioidaceae bacterium]|nr:thiamine ABC transporter substrate-binding protein [Nocardioidaceae bacterium]
MRSSTTSRPAPTTVRLAVAGVLGLALAGCSLGAGSEPPADGGAGGSGGSPSAAESGGTVVLRTHDSFAVPEQTLAAFTEETGYTVDVQSAGDAGQLVNTLALTAGDTDADVVFGIDNTFASRAVDAGVLAAYAPAGQPDSAGTYELPGSAGEDLTPVDVGDVCVNIDDTWFAERGIRPPETFEDLVDPTYADLFVTPGAATSSPGLAFLLATVAEYGEDGWAEYWQQLEDNGAQLTSGWSDAYYVDFTAGGGDGDRPIVLSYASSPPFTIDEESGEATTSALLDTCYRQVEYAGVLADTENPEGARALVDFMVSPAFQQTLPESMYVFPVDDEVSLPQDWQRFAELADDPLQLDPEQVSQNRETWLREWEDVVGG